MAGSLRRGTLLGLALFLPLIGNTDDGLPESNYLLINDPQHPENSRLLIFNEKSSAVIEEGIVATDADDDTSVALAMTGHENPRQRVLGLTLLSGDESMAALNAAMGLLYDSNVAVREEAIQLVMSHPDANVDLAKAIGSSDPAMRVRRATADLADELAQE